MEDKKDEKPTHLSREDALAFENAALKEQIAARQLADVRKEREALIADLKARYQLSDGDSVDPETRAITRVAAKE